MSVVIISQDPGDKRDEEDVNRVMAEPTNICLTLAKEAPVQRTISTSIKAKGGRARHIPPAVNNQRA